MGAGGSAAVEARRARLRAEEYRRCLADALADGARWGLAAETEARVAARLVALECLGWRLLADRRWPGSRNANVDLIAVGPGGVLVVDVKAWAEPRIENGRLFRGDEDCQDDLDGILRLAELAEQVTTDCGLAPLEVLPVVVLAGHRSVGARLGRVHVLGEGELDRFCTARGHRLNDEQIEVVAAAIERDFPPYETHQPMLVSPVVREPVLPREPEPLFDMNALVEADMAAALAAPLADWMTWLHPEQARFVRRAWNGPARIAGPAGTGKTVVALHRTAYLASTRPGRLLFVTFVKTLPVVLGTYYERLSPETAERVEFTGLHKWAKRLLDDRGVGYDLNRYKADALFRRAWTAVGGQGRLASMPVPLRYWRDEVSRVVKGRGLTEFAQYRDLNRLGRRMPLGADQRAAVWDLYEEYQRLLSEAGVHDFDDVLALALAEVRREPLDDYAAVVVDEVQDLTCVGVRLLHAVAGDRPDALLLIGDATQAVYPGGFTLAEAGIAVVGRSVRLRVNYRNAADVVAEASKVGATAAFEDVDGADLPVAPHVTRPAGNVRRHVASDATAHDEALVRAVRSVIGRKDVNPGEVAVLCATKHGIKAYRDLLKSEGVASIDLERCAGAATEAGKVKVGTFKRAKGLEFKYVLLPMLHEGEPARRADEGEAAYRERVEVERRELYVGMTRARDGLWLGYVDEARAESA